MVVLAAVGERRSNAPIIDTAADLATAYGDELQVLHVIPDADAQSHFQRLRSRAPFGDDEFEESPAQAERVAERMIDLAVEDDADRIVPVGRVGDPADEVLALADEVDARYVVIGGRKRTPAGKVLFGSMTQRIVLDTDRPVVIKSTTPTLSD